jgi:hypothetical protein
MALSFLLGLSPSPQRRLSDAGLGDVIWPFKGCARLSLSCAFWRRSAKPA